MTKWDLSWGFRVTFHGIFHGIYWDIPSGNFLHSELENSPFGWLIYQAKTW